MLALTLFKAALSALVLLVCICVVDDVNGSRKGDSPMWIAIPGALVGIAFILCAVAAVIAMIWGL